MRRPVRDGERGAPRARSGASSPGALSARPALRVAALAGVTTVFSAYSAAAAPQSAASASSAAVALSPPISAAAAALSPPISAPAPTGKIDAAVAAFSQWAASIGGHGGAAVTDVATGRVLAAADEHRALNPASNTKVLTAAAVLDKMGPDFRFTTALFGHIEDRRVAPLVIRGNGDPSLSTEDLWELASALHQLGVRKVDGILVDQSYFDDEYVPPAFASQPNEWAPFRAPVSAVSLERNSVTLNVVPGKAGSAATVWFDPPGFVDVRGSVATRAAPAGDGVRLTMSPNGVRLAADVAGFVGEGPPRLRFGKRVDDPRRFAGFVLADILRTMQIDVKGDVGLGGASIHSRITYIESEPLAVLVRELGKNSDNFYAETLLKTLGAFSHAPPARTRDGADAVAAWLKDIGALDPGFRMTNGSGLYDANRVSPWTLATVLRHAYWSPRVGADFVAQLAVGGVDGTLHARFRDRADDRTVRAKTGTLDQVVALSGYVLGPPGKSPVAFSFIADGVAGKHAEARDRIDKCVEAIAATLWGR
ncbi:MAG TPA: D-alanyl-D-alanine carboxypeptidase/D-alanyl-D-alanine-endopeptidase [Polyangiaceae bacterium]|nr:D-alanyl-D-alanine carboxypeptidase/D-alanyl-D-alanine-endopeptidase [Polyangiaceae bacterium]